MKSTAPTRKPFPSDGEMTEPHHDRQSIAESLVGRERWDASNCADFELSAPGTDKIARLAGAIVPRHNDFILDHGSTSTSRPSTGPS